MNTIAAIVVAAGRGKRFATAGELPKQLLILAGEPVYIWSLRVFCQHPCVSSVVLVIASDLLRAFQEGIQKYLPEYMDKIAFAYGGAARQSSVLSGLEHLAAKSSPPRFVLIHDAARPFVDESDLDKIVAALREGGGCTLALPVSDTVKEVQEDLIVGTVNRQDLYSMQTPQGAELVALLEAHRNLSVMGIETTDDAAVLERAMVPVKVVVGSPRNFKITTVEDFYLAQALAVRLKHECHSDTRYGV